VEDYNRWLFLMRKADGSKELQEGTDSVDQMLSTTEIFETKNLSSSIVPHQRKFSHLPTCSTSQPL
jgi:hypothetical protein